MAEKCLKNQSYFKCFLNISKNIKSFPKEIYKVNINQNYIIIFDFKRYMFVY